MPKTRKKLIVQEHHISYNPEEIVRVFKGEHYIFTQLQRRKNISKGFVKGLKVWVALNEDRAKEI